MSGDGDGLEEGDGRRRGRGRGQGRGRGSRNEGVEPPWMSPPWPRAEDIEGEWNGSLGHHIVAQAGAGRRPSLTAVLSRRGQEQSLSVRYEPSTGIWACGNGVLEVQSSTPSCLVWVTASGQRSTWVRQQENDREGGAERPPPDLLPWLLMPQLGPGGGPGGVEGSAAQAGMPLIDVERIDRRRWASIAEEMEEMEEGEEARGGPAAASATPPPAAAGGASGGGPTDLSVACDASRISALLDVRQVFGNDQSAHETLSALLMDHELLRREGEDVMVPALDSPLWERLDERPRRNALLRLGDFRAADRGFVPEAAPDLTEFRCGRHRIPAAATDVQALHRRWVGPQDSQKKADAMAHVISLYRTLENPLLPEWKRSSMQLGWDPVERKRAGVEYELFASPFNAGVAGGRYASRWPHAEANFGSLGSYPSVIDKIPVNVVVGINPPFTEGYLAHVMGQTLEGMVQRFKKVCLTVPIREAPWRSQLHRLKGAGFVNQFWDSTEQAAQNLGDRVLFWEGSELGQP